MPAGSTIVKYLAPQIISILAEGAIKLITGDESLDRPQANKQCHDENDKRATDPDQDYSTINNDTGEYAENQYINKLGYIWSSTASNCQPPNSTTGSAYQTQGDNVILRNRSTTEALNYISATFRGVPGLTDVEKGKLFNAMTATIIQLSQKGNTDWEMTSTSYYSVLDGQSEQLAIDVLYVYATATNDQGVIITFIQYRAATYTVNPLDQKGA